MLNPMLMSADAPWYQPRDDKHADEVRKHWAWLEAAMQEAKDKKRTHVFLLIHVPPFLGKPDEKAGYGNLPMDARKRLLDLARRFGATAILCGHCHSTREISVSTDRPSSRSVARPAPMPGTATGIASSASPATGSGRNSFRRGTERVIGTAGGPPRLQ